MNPACTCTCNITQDATGLIRNNCIIHLEDRLQQYIVAKILAKKKRADILQSSSMMIHGGLSAVEKEQESLNHKYQLNQFERLKLAYFFTTTKGVARLNSLWNMSVHDLQRQLMQN